MVLYIIVPDFIVCHVVVRPDLVFSYSIS